MNGRIVLAGGSGFLGRALAAAFLARGDDVVILTRTLERVSAGSDARSRRPTYVAWDAKSSGDWATLVDGAHAVVNLVGRSVDCRYTDENRREIVESRVDSVRAVARAIRQATRPPRALVQAGSLAIYGDPGDLECDEDAPPGVGFSAETCVAWERAFDVELTPTTRRVLFRIGFVLGKDGGALPILERLARRFMGGTVGKGRQYMSWLHIRDMVRMVLWAIDGDAAGTYNATGPSPVTNAAFMQALRAVLGRPWSPPTPAWAVALGARLMGTEASLALTGRRCVPRRIVEQGFRFDFPEFGPALIDVLAEP